jgi:hypothetical protein
MVGPFYRRFWDAGFVFAKFLERGTFVHGHVVGLIALDQVHLIFQGCHFRQAALMAFCFIETGGQEGFG